MNRIHATILLGLLAIGLGVVAVGPQKGGDTRFSQLHRVELADASELEVVMGLIERSPESTGAKHYHPGGEFGYILEGAMTFATENERPVALEAGDSFYQPPGEWHIASTAAEGVKAVVFRVLKKGQPMMVAVD